MNLPIAAFLEAEDGVITVEWVVLTAAVLGMAMVVLLPVALSTDSSVKGVADYIGDVEVGYGRN